MWNQYLKSENEKVYQEFEKSSKEYLNNKDMKRRLYRRGLSKEEFSGQLEEEAFPVY